MICISITRFISDHMWNLSASIVHSMTVRNDFPCVLVPLLENKPWEKTTEKGEVLIFEDN